MKTCKHCGGDITQRDNEKPCSFRRRVFCCVNCRDGYNSQKEDLTPTVEEIAAMTAEIRQGWNERDYYIRSRYMLGDHLKWKRS